ncbi:MAG: PAS domain S-box protein [Janthinobacterium lividum]
MSTALRLRRAGALGAALIGAIALSGWVLDMTVLKTVLPGLTTMKANTALGIIATACGLLLLPEAARRGAAPWRELGAALCGALALLLGALTLAEYAVHISLGLDELLFADPGTTSPPYPGRMAPVTAGVLACTGMAILLLARAARMPDQTGLYSAWTGHALAVVPAGAGYLGFAGYVYDVPGLYSFGPYSTVALNTSAAFLLLAPAILFTLRDLGWARGFAGRPVARRMMWRLLPASLLLPFLVGSVVVWGARVRVYSPLFGPALFALAAAASSLGLALFAVGAVRRAEAALLASEERYRLTVESARDHAIVTLDTAGRITGWNIGAERMMGYTEAEAVGRPAAIFFRPEDVAAGVDKAEMKRAAAEGRAEDERWHRRRDGSQFWGSGLVMPLAGTPGGYVKIFQDKTAERTALERLREGEERSRVAIEAGRFGSWQIDLRTGSMATSDVFRRIFGAAPGRKLSVNEAFAILHPNDREPVRRALQASYDTEVDYQAEYRVIWPDGTERWVVGYGRPFYGEDGTPLRIIGLVQDITERKRTEAALRQLNEELESRVTAEVQARETAQSRLAHAQRMEALGQLAGGIAHDFNNVMQAVQGGAGLIRRRASNPQTVDHLARMVEEAAERGGSVTRRLLAFARKGELHAETLDTVALLDGVREVLEHTLGAGITVRTEAVSPLPPLLADKGQLETVLVNLAANARDAMPHGGTLTLSAAAEAVVEAAMGGKTPHEAALLPSRYVRLAMSDTGEGMAAAVLARASEPFFTTKEQGRGTGLGLAMARGFAEQSGGGLAIRSTLGAGTTVTLWLPAAEDTVPSCANGADQGKAAQLVDRVRVLVVDDEDLVREVLAEGLEERGYATQRASSAGAALAMLDAGAGVDALLTDYAMPGMDGLTLIGEARRRRPGLVSVLLTGNVSGEVEARLALDGMAGGPFSLLRKPVRADELAARIGVVLAQKDRAQPLGGTTE